MNKKIVCIFIVGLFIGAGIVSCISGKKFNIDNYDDGLVGHWKFNEGNGDWTYDSSGYGNNGQIMGAIWTDQSVCDFCEYALVFDGLNDYVNCRDDSSLNPTDEITIEGWVKPNNPNLDFTGNFVGMDICGYYCGVWTDTLTFGFFDPDAEQANVNGCVHVFYKRSSPSNDWVHVAFTYSIINRTIKMYLNGIKVKSYVTSGGDGKITYQGPSDILIGKQWGGYFDGVVDDVRIYNRELNDTEIREHYEQPCGEPPDDYEEPECSIIRPRKGIIYRNNKEIRESDNGETLIAGPIEIWVLASSNVSSIEKVEFYIDNIYNFGVGEPDLDGFYKWLWEEPNLGFHNIKAMAWDYNGSNGSCEIDVQIFEGRSKNIMMNKIINAFELLNHYELPLIGHLLSVSSNILVEMDDVEMFISAGHRGKNIGFWVYFKVINHKEKSIDSSYKIEYFSFSDVYLRETTGDLFRVRPEESEEMGIHWQFTNNPYCIISKFNVTLNADSYKLSRDGIKIGRLYMLN